MYGQLWVRFGAVLEMDIFLIVFGVVSVCLLNISILALSLQNRTQLAVLEQGFAAALTSIYESVQQIADLPEALKGVGGVQLMPQKTFGEIAAEMIMGKIFGQQAGLNDEPVSPDSWQPENADNLNPEDADLRPITP